MPILYGSLPNKQVDVAHSIGWFKPTKRQKAVAKNNGRPPDTTKQLLSVAENPKNQVKLG
jgi:hypothetical protein